MGSNDKSPKPDNSILYNGVSAFFLSVLFMIIFICFRKRFKWVYYPNSAHLKSHPVLPEASRYAWFRHSFSLPDANLLTLVGLDGFILLMTLKLLFLAFFWLTVVALLVLLPIYAVAGTNAVNHLYFELSIIHLSSGSKWLWAPFVLSYLFTFYLFYIIFLYYNSFVTLRQTFTANPACLTSVLELARLYQVTGSIETTYNVLNLQSHTILVEGLDKRKFKSEDHVVAFFDGINIGNVKEAIFVKDNVRLRHLIQKRNEMLLLLEKCYTNLLRDVLVDLKKASKSKSEPRTHTIPTLTFDNITNTDGFFPTQDEKESLLAYTVMPSFLPYYRPTVMEGCCHRREIDLIIRYSCRLSYYQTKINNERTRILEYNRQMLLHGSKFYKELDEKSHVGKSPYGQKSDRSKSSELEQESESELNPVVSFVESSVVNQEPALQAIAEEQQQPKLSIRDPTTDEAYIEAEAGGGASPSVMRIHRLAEDQASFLPIVLGHRDALKDFRLAVPNTTRAAFVIFNEPVAASIVSQCLIDSELFSCIPAKAPHSQEINWRNLTLPISARSSRRYLGTVIFLAINLLWSIPVAFVNSLNHLSTIANTFSFLSFLLKLPPTLQTIIEGSISPLLLNCLLIIVPYIFHYLSLFQGCKSQSEVQISLLQKYLTFLFIQVFFISFLSGSIWNAITPIMNNDFEKVLIELKHSLSAKSTFFFNLIILRIPFDIFMVLANPIGLVLFWLKEGLLSSATPRERQQSRVAEKINYGMLYPSLVFVLPLVLTYACISPIILLIGTLYYGIAYLVYRYQYLYAVTTEFECGGSHWQTISGFLIISILTFQFMTGLQFSVQGAALQALLMLPLMGLTVFYYSRLCSTYNKRSEYIPLSRRADLAAAKSYSHYSPSIPKIMAKDSAYVKGFENYSVLSLIAAFSSRQKSILSELITNSELAADDVEDVKMPNVTIFGFAPQNPSPLPLQTHQDDSSPVSLSGHHVSALEKKDQEFLKVYAQVEQVQSGTPLMISKSTEPDFGTTSSSHVAEERPLDGISSSLRDDISSRRSTLALDDDMDWFMYNPYRNPTLFKKLNSLYLPKHFFKLIQVVKEADTAAAAVTLGSSSLNSTAMGSEASSHFHGVTLPK